MQTDLKFCRDCKFYGFSQAWYSVDANYEGSCRKQQRTTKKTISLVSGNELGKINASAHENRYAGACGTEGEFFELKVLK
jgi:hypothetical protein